MRPRGDDSLALVATGLGARLRANAGLLELALDAGRLGKRHLRALVEDLYHDAAAADRLFEAEAWLREAARGRRATPARRAA